MDCEGCVLKRGSVLSSYALTPLQHDLRALHELFSLGAGGVDLLSNLQLRCLYLLREHGVSQLASVRHPSLPCCTLLCCGLATFVIDVVRKRHLRAVEHKRKGRGLQDRVVLVVHEILG